MLRAYGDADFDLTVEIETDPDVMKHLGGPRPLEALRRVHGVRVATDWWFVIADDASGDSLGAIGTWESEHAGERIHETGWTVLPAAQGRGVASAALTELIERVRSDPSFTALHAFPPVTNAPSIRLCEKHGFVRGEEFDGAFADAKLRLVHYTVDVSG